MYNWSTIEFLKLFTFVLDHRAYVHLKFSSRGFNCKSIGGSNEGCNIVVPIEPISPPATKILHEMIILCKIK